MSFSNPQSSGSTPRLDNWAAEENLPLDLGTKDGDPVQLGLSFFSKNDSGTQKLCFNTLCFDSFSFLEYSVQKNAGFCIPCCQFPTLNAYLAFPKSSFTVVLLIDVSAESMNKGKI